MNSVTACQRCNNQKGNRTPEDANMPLLAIPLFHHAEYLILEDEESVLMDGLSVISRAQIKSNQGRDISKADRCQNLRF